MYLWSAGLRIQPAARLTGGLEEVADIVASGNLAAGVRAVDPCAVLCLLELPIQCPVAGKMRHHHAQSAHAADMHSHVPISMTAVDGLMKRHGSSIECSLSHDVRQSSSVCVACC